MPQGLIEIRVIRGSDVAMKRKLLKVSRDIKNPKKANKAVSVWLLRWVNENFRTEGGKVGKWKPFKLGGRRLPDGTIDESAKLLQDTGRLRKSFNPFHTRTVAGIGTSLNYSLTHELGLPHRNVPVRRMLPMSSDANVQRAIVQIYEAYIRRVLR